MQVRLSLYYLRSVFRKRFAGLFGRHEIIVMLVICYVVRCDASHPLLKGLLLNRCKGSEKFAGVQLFEDYKLRS